MSRAFWNSTTPPKKAGQHSVHKSADDNPLGNRERNAAIREYDTVSKRLRTAGNTYSSGRSSALSIVKRAVVDPVGTVIDATDAVLSKDNTTARQRTKDRRYTEAVRDEENAVINLFNTTPKRSKK